MTTDRALTVAVLGTGTMGEPMARNLLRAGLAVRAWNRSGERAAALESDGAQVAGTPAEAVAGADVILTVLSDADATLEVAGAALGEAAADAVWVQAGTIGVEATERCAALASEHGIALVDAPVLGTRQPAEQGKLIVLASGPEDQRERVAPVFDAVGARTLWVGSAGAGTRLKLVCNTWLIALVEGLAETMALAERLGVDADDFYAAIEGGGLDAGYAHVKGKAMRERDFTPSFKLVHAAKDARLVSEAAAGEDLALPLVAAARVAFEQGTTAGHGDKDMAAALLTLLDGD
jgi:3-hydroxyisobutyrate dehydrogenase